MQQADPVGLVHFDGQRYANASFPGISGTMARTAAFWVKISPDAQPVDTWMVAWGTDLPKLGHRPVHIGWNRRPFEGALGALRTDFGGGHAIGTTTLRDGQWHHIAVIFSPGDDPNSLVQVKQYVDGRLESSTIVRGTLSTRAGTGDATLTDTVWLGYRLTGTRQEGRRFRGDLDELFIVNRPLQPQEIVSLLETNRLPEAAFASSPEARSTIIKPFPSVDISLEYQLSRRVSIFGSSRNVFGAPRHYERFTSETPYYSRICRNSPVGVMNAIGVKGTF